MDRRSLFNLPFPEIDYTFLMSMLQQYRKPRDVVTGLLRREELVRVKKGLYVLGPGCHQAPVSKEVLANLIYGPSYLSLDWALSLYGLIPEGVAEMTSMTRNRNKFFETPLGRFTYRFVPPRLFSPGVQIRPVDDRRWFLVATPEKALVEKIRLVRPRPDCSIKNLLFDDFRIDVSGLRKFNLGRLRNLVELFALSDGDDLVSLVCDLKKGAHTDE